MNVTETTVYLSKKGMKELKKEIAELEHDKQMAELTLREMDKTDGHDERLARIELLSHLETLDAELADKKSILVHAKLLPRKRDAIKVAMGSVVDLLDTHGRIIRYTLVDTIEANPSDGRISVKSPLGQNLIGKQMKDIVEWSAGLRTNRLQLISIS
jgi:transcription elongation GreA/GreB family factor